MSDLVALVTGGSGGIGAATCRALSAAGMAVLVGYGRAHQTAAEVARSCAGPAEAVACDVTAPDQVRGAVERAGEFGRLHVLVHAAGIADDDLLLRLEPHRWDRTIEVNLRGAYLACRAALRPMLRARCGRIVLVTSVVGLRGNAGQTAYGAAKAGLIGLAKSLAREVARKGITVNAVAPGYVETPMTAGIPDEVRARHVEESPLGRAVTAVEVAAAIRFLTSDEAAPITGAVLPVDGGTTI
ncbi:MAG: 3-oxoacyl-ACP reductase FabG [Nitriliruptorales bacterium]